MFAAVVTLHCDSMIFIGGYTMLWDRICGTMRKKYEHDFENPKARRLYEEEERAGLGVADPSPGNAQQW